jgi:hypothetical protein
MINYDDIKKDSLITGVSIDGEEVTGVCTNVMKGFRMVSIKYGEDRLDKAIVEFENILSIEKE